MTPPWTDALARMRARVARTAETVIGALAGRHDPSKIV